MGKTGDEWLTVKLAADKKQAELSMLLTSRADPNVMVPVEWRDFATSPLFEAAVSGHTRIARMLLSAGADVNASVGPGYTPVYNAAYNGHADTVRLLAESNADVNAATAEEFTPLYIACQQGHTECVRVLLESNASCNLARAAEGATALYIASQNGHAGCVEALISHGGATIDMPMFDGSTPLMIACYFKHVRVVEMLLRAGASLKLRDKRGRDALDWAKKRDDALVVALVEEELAARVAQGLGGRSEWNPDAESGGQGVGWFGGGGSSGGGGGNSNSSSTRTTAPRSPDPFVTLGSSKVRACTSVPLVHAAVGRRPLNVYVSTHVYNDGQLKNQERRRPNSHQS